MNERIRELAEQARYDSKNEKHYLERLHNREITLDEYQEIYDKKFAELIVQECIDIVSPYAIRMENFDGGHPVTDLKKHFGVKELAKKI